MNKIKGFLRWLKKVTIGYRASDIFRDDLGRLLEKVTADGENN